MLSTKALGFVLGCTLLILAPSGDRAGVRDNRPVSSTGISRLVERRDGRLSCWGVVIQLDQLKLRPVIKPEQISAVEAKHGHELQEMMTWRGERGERQLVIKFKPGMGDFGSENSVDIRLSRTAFVGKARVPVDGVVWRIGTDI
ncbi:MAG: hypothetical protein M3371_11575 [Acidobacteriota bacterium]|nr:hypothetical protein [Acidobacteriota bacterium]